MSWSGSPSLFSWNTIIQSSPNTFLETTSYNIVGAATFGIQVGSITVGWNSQYNIDFNIWGLGNGGGGYCAMDAQPLKKVIK